MDRKGLRSSELPLADSPVSSAGVESLRAPAETFEHLVLSDCGRSAAVFQTVVSRVGKGDLPENCLLSSASFSEGVPAAILPSSSVSVGQHRLGAVVVAAPVLGRRRDCLPFSFRPFVSRARRSEIRSEPVCRLGQPVSGPLPEAAVASRKVGVGHDRRSLRGAAGAFEHPGQKGGGLRAVGVSGVVESILQTQGQAVQPRRCKRTPEAPSAVVVFERSGLRESAVAFQRRR